MLEVTSSISQLFADDTKVFRPVHSPDDQKTLKKYLDNLVEWSENWQLRFNASKCKVLHIGKNNPRYEYSMKAGDKRQQLEETDLEKDIGVNIDPLLKFSTHIERQ